MTEMFLAGITMDTSKACPVMVLTDGERQRALPIWISPVDATALVIAMNETKPPRPLTHDLIQNIIYNVGWKVKCVELNELNSDTLLAIVVLISTSGDGNEVRLDSRPSDAIALAIKFEAPIMVSLEVLASASVSVDLDRDERDSIEFKQFVNGLKASDFNQLQRDH